MTDELDDATITACALVIKGLCMTLPAEEWTDKIEARIAYLIAQKDRDIEALKLDCEAQIALQKEAAEQVEGLAAKCALLAASLDQQDRRVEELEAERAKLEIAMADCRDAFSELGVQADDLLMNAVGDPFAVPAFVIEGVRVLTADAERYRYLRHWTQGTNIHEQRNNVVMKHGRFILPHIEPVGDIMRGSVAQHLDEAIDAAVAKKEG